MAAVPSTADFIDNYPEFAGADDDLVSVKLAQAARRTNADVYSSLELAADAVMLRAAVLLLKSPGGRKMRLANPDQLFTWQTELRQLQGSATMGLRVFP
jgi:hypothetical protein